jgi:hypothetical protein
MITKETALAVWMAHDEIAKGEKLLAEMSELRKRGDLMNLRDQFGRHRNLQLGIPNGENSMRLLDVHPELAIAVIQAHIANKRSELIAINEKAKAELA